MVLFNNIPYKHMRLKNKVNLTKPFSKKYKRVHLITRLYGIYIHIIKVNDGEIELLQMNLVVSHKI